MKIFITGATGFAGSHLLDLVLSGSVGEHEAAGFRLPGAPMENVAHVAKQVTWYDGDVTDADAVEKAIAAFRPDRVFHLAAISFVPTSWENPSLVIDVNVKGTVNILEAVKNKAPKARVQLACSTEEYGRVEPEDLPTREEAPLRPLSPYGVSKVAADMIGFQYDRGFGIHVVRTRAFNHSGPRQNPDYVLADFAKQVMEAKAGKRPAITVGNTEAVRDFNDVRDIVRAYWLALEKCPPGAYNVCGGKGTRAKDALSILMRMASVAVPVRSDPERMRPSDVPIHIGDASLFRKTTGWKPQYKLEDLLKSLLAYWGERIHQTADEVT